MDDKEVAMTETAVQAPQTKQARAWPPAVAYTGAGLSFVAGFFIWVPWLLGRLIRNWNNPVAYPTFANRKKHVDLCAAGVITLIAFGIFITPALTATDQETAGVFWFCSAIWGGVYTHFFFEFLE